MCALAYYLEQEGVATTGIALVRENAEALRPPRMLWVPFPLGRPLGNANDSAFQKRVMQAALDLFQRDQGPVLEDFPEEATDPPGEVVPVCPVSFGGQGTTSMSWTKRLLEEFNLLDPLHASSLRRRGRTNVGLSRRSVKELTQLIATTLEAPELNNELLELKRAIDDVRAFYLEALGAESPAAARNAERWFWQESAMGDALVQLHDRYLRDAQRSAFSRVIAPRHAVAARSTSSAAFAPARPKTEK